ncbi:MAG TPA: M48 family metallopeptidase [Polyangiales bacterium]|nr:M48 family metallopeptidase [Polyangiales bacterium]
MAAFFEHQAEARRNTRWLLLGMMAAVLGTGVGMYCLLVLIQLVTTRTRTVFGYEFGFWQPRLFAACVLSTALIVICASAYRMFSLRGGGARVAERLGGRLVSGQPRDFLEKRLLNVVEEMGIASGVPVPQVFVLDSEAGINAFAAGFSLEDAAIAVTRGALEKLTRAELQGVIAHEYSHVLNGDMRLNTRLIGTVFGILCIGMCGRVLMRIAGNGRRTSVRSKNGGGYLFAVGLGMFLVGWVGELLGKLIKAAVSRQREFLADASAAQFTRDPVSVAGALKKIGGHASGAAVLAPAAEEASHIFFGDLSDHLFAHSWFATHPPLSERILRLDASFRGEFVVTADGVAEPEETLGGVVSRAAPVGLGAVGIVSRVGQPTRDALEESRLRLAQLPAAVRDAASNPFSACALVYALWLNEGAQQQLARIAAISGPELSVEAARWATFVSGLSQSVRLSLVELAAPALRELSKEQRLRFARTIEALTLADQRRSIFEEVVGALLAELATAEADARERSRVRHKRLAGVQSELQLVLSLLAHAGASSAEAAAESFAAARARLSGVKLELLPSSDRLLHALGPALSELRALAPELAGNVVDACAHGVLADRRVSADEAALLRAVCAALRCPLPLIEGEVFVQ